MSTRSAPAAQAALAAELGQILGLLRVRDGGCRFPGCSRRTAGCDLDHTIDWATGATTSHTCAASTTGSNTTPGGG